MLHNELPEKQPTRPMSLPAAGGDRPLDDERFDGAAMPAVDYRSAYLDGGRHVQGNLSAEPDRSPRNSETEIAPKGVSEYFDCDACITLMKDAAKAHSQGNYFGAIGRAALGAIPTAVDAAGLLTQMTGGLTAIASIGVAYLGHLGWDLAVFNYGLFGVACGLFAVAAGEGIRHAAGWTCHRIRETYGDTNVTYEEACREPVSPGH